MDRAEEAAACNRDLAACRVSGGTSVRRANPAFPSGSPAHRWASGKSRRRRASHAVAGTESCDWAGETGWAKRRQESGGPKSANPAGMNGTSPEIPGGAGRHGAALADARVRVTRPERALRCRRSADGRGSDSVRNAPSLAYAPSRGLAPADMCGTFWWRALSPGEGTWHRKNCKTSWPS